MIILDKELVLKTLGEIRNKEKAAQVLMISKKTLNSRLKEWGVHDEYTQTRKPDRPPFPIYAIGERVIWKPLKARENFFGFTEAHEPWPCIIVRGPSPTGIYAIRYDGENRTRRAARKIHTVVGARLFKETE